MRHVNLTITTKMAGLNRPWRIEDRTAPIVKSIADGGALPDRKSEDFSLLIMFLASLHLRCKSRGEKVRNLLKTVLRRGVDLLNAEGQDWNDLEIDVKYPSRLELSQLRSTHDSLLDLAYIRVENGSSVGFVTSDTPVILTNPFARYKGLLNDSCGLQSLGLVIFLPLSPTVAVCALDPYVYRTASARYKSFSITESHEIQLINAHHILQGLTTLYFSQYSETILRGLVSQWAQHRGCIADSLEAVTVRRGGILEDGFHLINRVPPKLEPRHQFLRILPGPKTTALDQGRSYVRNAARVRELRYKYG